MKKKVNDSKDNTPNKVNKKEIMRFLAKAKKSAKVAGISYNMRITNYINENKEVYTYGIR